MSNLIKSINVPLDVRKQTTMMKAQFYDRFDLYPNRLVGLLNGQEEIAWFLKTILLSKLLMLI